MVEIVFAIPFIAGLIAFFLPKFLGRSLLVLTVVMFLGLLLFSRVEKTFMDTV